MTTLRSLIAELGFQVDTTPADRFNSAVNKSKNTLNSLNFINLSGFNKNIKKGLKTAAGIVAAGIAAGIVTAIKFANVKQALSQLKFQFKDSFQPLRDEVADILADPVFGKLTTELDLLNAAAAAVGTGIDPDVIIRNLRNILGFSTVFRQNITEGIAPFIDFIKTGNLEILLKTGRLTAEQAVFLQKAGIDPSREAVRARIIRLEDLFKDISPEIRKSLEKLIEEGALSQKRLASSFDTLTLEIGKKTLPAFRQLTEEGLIPMMDRITRFISDEELTPEQIKTEKETSAKKREELAEPIFTESFRKPIVTQFIEFFQNKSTENILSDISTKLQKPLFTPFQTTNNQEGDTTNNITVIVQPGATGDPNEIKRAVGDELGKVFGRSVEQSKNNRLIRGKGEVQ